jgi:hypothetical protein
MCKYAARMRVTRCSSCLSEDGLKSCRHHHAASAVDDLGDMVGGAAEGCSLVSLVWFSAILFRNERDGVVFHPTLI